MRVYVFFKINLGFLGFYQILWFWVLSLGFRVLHFNSFQIRQPLQFSIDLRPRVVRLNFAVQGKELVRLRVRVFYSSNRGPELPRPTIRNPLLILVKGRDTTNQGSTLLYTVNFDPVEFRSYMRVKYGTLTGSLPAFRSWWWR